MTYRPEYRLIPGEGPTSPGGLMAIGEAGGEWENLKGRPFIGKSGWLLDTYLAKNLVPRHRIYIDNLYPHWTGPGNPAPTKEQIDYGAIRLSRTLNSLRPRFILALGRYAIDHLRGTSVSLEVSHGLPFLLRPSGWDYPAVVVPAYHPAAALRDPETSGKCFYDISQFSLIARGLLRPVVPTDVAPHTRYSLGDKAVVAGPEPAIDTEGFTDSPYCISYSTRDGEATVVLAKDITPGERLPLGRDNITFHHSMHDLPVLRAMGIIVDPWRFDDTILMARLLLLEPAGLKDLALRHCGMSMRTYDEVVGPHFQKAVKRYIKRAAKVDWGKPDAQAVRDKKTGKWKIYQPQPISNRLASIVRDLESGKQVDIKARWEKISPELKAPVVTRLGGFPVSHPRLAPLEELVQYAGRDPDATRRVQGKLWPMIVARKLVRAYRTDLHSIPMFERMAANGMQIDPNHFASMRPAIVTQLEEGSKEWCRKFNSGTYLSLSSGDQVAEFLFGKCGLKPIKQTRGGTRPSVDEKTLELLKDQHPSIPPLMAWKKLHTNLTFVDRIPKWMREDHRIYPNINTQGTVTGRPSTSDPNLLNIPVRTELGKQIRMGFIAPQGKRLLSVDLSQIELRIGAHLSQDKEMMRAFQKGEDLHQKTADLLGISRYTAKTINFGIFYGMSWLRLHSELLEAGAHPPIKAKHGVTSEWARKHQTCSYCEDVIREWFKLFRGVKAWLSDLLAGARRRGYVRGLSGRLRYLPNLYMREGSPLRSEAERHAGNFPVQEGAGYVIKRAMRRMWKWNLAHHEEKVEPLLQIYDELLFEVPKLSAKEMSKVHAKMMVADEKLFSVPLKADSAVGRKWGEL